MRFFRNCEHFSAMRQNFPSFGPWRRFFRQTGWSCTSDGTGRGHFCNARRSSEGHACEPHRHAHAKARRVDSWTLSPRFQRGIGMNRLFWRHPPSPRAAPERMGVTPCARTRHALLNIASDGVHALGRRDTRTLNTKERRQTRGAHSIHRQAIEIPKSYRRYDRDFRHGNTGIIASAGPAAPGPYPGNACGSRPDGCSTSQLPDWRRG